MSQISKKKYRSMRDIEAAFIELLQIRDYKSITVQHIVDKAEYSKSTFYTHFLDKDDLAHQTIVNELDILANYMYENTKEITFSTPIENAKEACLTSYKNVFSHIFERRALYSLILENKYPNVTFTSLSDLFAEHTKNHYDLKTGSVDPDLFLHFDAAWIFTIISWWAKHDFHHSPHYMATQALELHGPVFTYASFSAKNTDR